MKLGYTFVWPPNEQPFMIDQSGKRIDLHSKDDIPYLIPGDDSEPGDDQLVSDAPALAGEDGDHGDDGDDAEAEVPHDDAEDDEGEGLIEVDVHEGEPRFLAWRSPVH